MILDKSFKKIGLSDRCLSEETDPSLHLIVKITVYRRSCLELFSAAFLPELLTGFFEMVENIKEESDSVVC